MVLLYFGEYGPYISLPLEGSINFPLDWIIDIVGALISF